jgi:hypothetical protein
MSSVLLPVKSRVFWISVKEHNRGTQIVERQKNYQRLLGGIWQHALGQMEVSV